MLKVRRLYQKRGENDWRVNSLVVCHVDGLKVEANYIHLPLKCSDCGNFRALTPEEAFSSLESRTTLLLLDVTDTSLSRDRLSPLKACCVKSTMVRIANID